MESHEGKAIVLARALLGEISRRELAPGAALPSQRALATGNGMARSSVQVAIATLEAWGVVESQHGRGTFVVTEVDRVLSDTHFDLLDPRGVSPVEVHLLDRVSRRPIDTLIGLVLETVGAGFFDGTGSWELAPDGPERASLSWSHCISVESVQRALLPRWNDAHDALLGVPGLRYGQPQRDGATLMWLGPRSRCYLRLEWRHSSATGA